LVSQEQRGRAVVHRLIHSFHQPGAPTGAMAKTPFSPHGRLEDEDARDPRRPSTEHLDRQPQGSELDAPVYASSGNKCS